MAGLFRPVLPIFFLPGCHAGGGKLSVRNAGARKSATLFNWLKYLDSEAKKLPRAKDWLHPYDLFMLFRHPRLQPRSIPGNSRSRVMWESGFETTTKLLAEWESRIAENMETSICLYELSVKSRKELFALMVDIKGDLERRPAERYHSQFFNRIIKEAEVRIGKLDTKLQKAREALTELKEYAEDSGERTSIDLNSTLHNARQMLGASYLRVASNALTALGVGRGLSAQRHIEIATESLSSGVLDPEVFAMVRLYWFFKHGCRLTGDESEVRVALLRNTFWTGYGIQPVDLRDKYIPGESRGCGAVRQAVRRLHP
jgi:hypothetical protein